MPTAIIKKIHCSQTIDEDGSDLITLILRKFDRMAIQGPITLVAGQEILPDLRLSYHGQVADIELWEGSIGTGSKLDTKYAKSADVGGGDKIKSYQIERGERVGKYEVTCEVT